LSRQYGRAALGVTGQRKHELTRRLAASALLASLTLVAFAASAQEKIKTQRLLQQGVTYPAPDQAGEVTVLRITLAPGARTGRHRHPFPPTAYVLEGRLDVTIDGIGIRHYRAGDTFVETSATHEGSNPGSTPTVLLAIFPAAEGVPLTVPE
jgi:quercetin dioxygenase-like cupin family protein